MLCNDFYAVKLKFCLCSGCLWHGDGRSVDMGNMYNLTSFPGTDISLFPKWTFPRNDSFPADSTVRRFYMPETFLALPLDEAFLRCEVKTIYKRQRRKNTQKVRLYCTYSKAIKICLNN